MFLKSVVKYKHDINAVMLTMYFKKSKEYAFLIISKKMDLINTSTWEKEKEIN